MNTIDQGQSPALLNPKLQFALTMVLGITLPVMATVTWIGDLRASRTDNAQKAKQPSFPAFLIDLNKATEPELNLLPGVGPLSAQRIIDNRQEFGEFSSFEDLQRVPGIGSKTAAGMKPFCKPLVPSGVTSGEPASGEP